MPGSLDFKGMDSRLIERGYKADFIIKFCLLVIIGAMLSGLFLFFIWEREVGITYSKAISTLVSVRGLLIPAIVVSILLQVLLISLISIGLTLLVSHKIAGPIYRLEKDLEVIGQGDLTVNIRFRSRDQIHKLAESFNQMTQDLNGKARGIMDAESTVRMWQRRLEDEAGREEFSIEEIETILRGLRQQVAELKEKMGEFRI